MKKFLLIGAMLSFGYVHSAVAATITDGSFETPIVGGAYTTLSPGDTSMGWTVGGAGVDQIGSNWNASEGKQSVDLNSTGPGSLSQIVSDLVVGTTYAITFAMSGNPDRNPPNLKEMMVSMGSTSQTYMFDALNATASNMGWIYDSLYFTAEATALTLTFQSMNDSNGGIALDDVNISAVPLPAGGFLLLGGLLAGYGALRRRRT